HYFSNNFNSLYNHTSRHCLDYLFYFKTFAWRSLSCPRSELRLHLTLGCGQTFRWCETADGHWTGVMRGKVWTLTQTEDTLWYYVEDEEQLLGKMSRRKIDMKQEEGELLRDYFQFGVKLGDLYSDWSTVDPHFKHTANIQK
uniref:8-oxoguanine DNA glycosylase N-terminal domain-containing protein n=1 Tax=Sinocyclocheilus grahami TaxID=75366 RepID=A0A672NJD3_SINGR